MFDNHELEIIINALHMYYYNLGDSDHKKEVDYLLAKCKVKYSNNLRKESQYD